MNRFLRPRTRARDRSAPRADSLGPAPPLCGDHRRLRFSGTHGGPRRGCRTNVPRLQGRTNPTPGNSSHRSRQETRWRLAVPRGGRRTSRTGRVGPRHVRLPAAAAVCDGARSSNDYSSGRRTFARLETAAGFRSPRSTDVVGSAFIRTAPGQRRPPGVTRFPVVCMPHRLRTVKTRRAPKFTPKQATWFT